MNRTLAEVLLLVSVAMNAALLTFLAGVLRKVMNDMEGGAFKQFLGSLYHHSTRSLFMNAVLTIPLVGAIPYFYFYGFRNWWITSGLAFWLIAGSIAKMIKLPVFKTIGVLDSGDVAGLNEARARINAGNLLQAILNWVATALMAVAFVRR